MKPLDEGEGGLGVASRLLEVYVEDYIAAAALGKVAFNLTTLEAAILAKVCPRIGAKMRVFERVLAPRDGDHFFPACTCYRGLEYKPDASCAACNRWRRP